MLNGDYLSSYEYEYEYEYVYEYDVKNKQIIL